MAFSKITKDMNIIAALDDEPNDVGGLSAAQLKAKFDEGGLALKTFINNWIDAIAAGTAAANIGAKNANDEAVTLQAQLDDLNGAVAGTIPDGSVTTAKLHDGAVTDAKIDWSTSGILRCESFSYVGTDTYGSEANATVLTFTHKPRFFVITQVSGSTPMWVNYGKDQGVFSWDALEDAWNSRGTYTYASTVYPRSYEASIYELKFTISGNALKFWNAQSSAYQYNASTLYRVISVY